MDGWMDEGAVSPVWMDRDGKVAKKVIGYR